MKVRNLSIMIPFFEGIFQRERLLDIIKNFICFAKEEKGSAKILAGYHQYFAVKKAIERTKHATVSNGKIGVFWHTQGSGKSLSMVFYAHLLQQELSQPTIVVITDRNDLDDQLYTQFSKCKEFLRQTPVQANSRENLKELLSGREANGIIFTTMQKFEESDEPLSERRNIIVMTDEHIEDNMALRKKSMPLQVRSLSARQESFTIHYPMLHILALLVHLSLLKTEIP